MLPLLAIAALSLGQCSSGACEVRSGFHYVPHIAHHRVHQHYQHKHKFCGEWPRSTDKYTVTYCYYGERDNPSQGTWTVYESVFNEPQQRNVWVKVADFTSHEKAKEYISEE